MTKFDKKASPSGYENIFNNNRGLLRATKKLYTAPNPFENFRHLPIEELDDLSNSYINRANIETELLESLYQSDESSIIILVGAEGIGKTSTTHYTFGYLARKAYEEHNINFHFININTMGFTAASSAADMEVRIVNTLNHEISTVLTPYYSDYDAYLDKVEQNTVLVKTELGSANVHQFVLGFIAYLASACHNHKIKLVINLDNIDQLTTSQQKDVFSAMTEINQGINDKQIFFRPENDKGLPIAAPHGINTNIIFVIPLRPETLHSINHIGGQFWSLNANSSIPIPIENPLEPWHMVLKTLEASLSSNDFTEEPIVKFFESNDEGTATFSSPNPREFLEEYLNTMQTQLPNVADLIQKIAGKSNRRARIFAVKGCTHNYMLEGYLQREDYYRANDIEAIETRFKAALFDVFQPETAKGGLPTWKELIFNPFNIVNGENGWQDAPLLGWVGFCLVHMCLTNGQAKETREIDVDDQLFKPFKAVGISDVHVERLITAMVDAGLLRQTSLDTVSRCSSKFCKVMVIDRAAVIGYHSILFADNISTTMLFLEQCYRSIKGHSTKRPWHENLVRFNWVLSLLKHIDNKQALFVGFLGNCTDTEQRKRLNKITLPNSLYLEKIVPVIETRTKKLGNSLLVDGSTKKPADLEHIRSQISEIKMKISELQNAHTD